MITCPLVLMLISELKLTLYMCRLHSSLFNDKATKALLGFQNGGGTRWLLN